MVQKCANPVCSEPFREFRNGKIYRVNRRDAMPRVLQEACPLPRGEPFERSPSFLTRANVEPIGPRPQRECEKNLAEGGSRPAEHTPRILVLDVELKTLGLMEQALQDSGYSAITSTSGAETITLLATGFFDFFIVIARPARSHAAVFPVVPWHAEYLTIGYDTRFNSWHRVPSLRFHDRMKRRLPRRAMSLPYGLSLVEHSLGCRLRSEDFFCALPQESLEAFNQIKQAVVSPARKSAQEQLVAGCLGG